MDADAESKTYTRDTIGEIIGAAMPAIEIVANRYGDFRIRGAPTLIAEDFFHEARVPGAPVSNRQGIYFAAVAGRTLVDGMEQGIGVEALS